jgi:hypothetical protein
MTVSRQEEDSPSMCIRMAYVQRCTCVFFFCLTRVSFFVGQRKVDQAKKKGAITSFQRPITFFFFRPGQKNYNRYCLKQESKDFKAPFLSDV